jgi:putative transposase
MLRRMPITSGRGHSALRLGRHSVSGGEYFLTCCTAARQSGLESLIITARLLEIARGLSDDGTWLLRSAVIMHDHVHLLVVLGEHTVLSGALRLFKGRASPCLRGANLGWERGYFDHRIRQKEDLLPVFLYIFLNPYRAELLKSDARWPGYYCGKEDWAWFSPLTNQECPVPEWIL